MNVQRMTPQQIREAGIKALTRELGVVGMIRFLQQFELGSGDYSRERHAWLDDYSVEDIAGMVREQKVVYRRKK